MIHKVPSPKTDCVRVIFELPACIWADHIFLVGDFNEWSPTVTPFTQSRDGIWRAVVDLPVGREYEFRYLVDGTWQTDYHADGWASNEYGSQNSIVDASLPPDSASAVGVASLLHEGLSGSSRTPVYSYAVRSTASAPSDALRRFFPSPTRAAS